MSESPSKPLSMLQASRTLEELRHEIDRIDDALHDLLMQRAALSDEIVRAKLPGQNGSAPLAIRPAREAAILRRLLARHRGSLSPEVVVAIWREIISASLQAQTPFMLQVSAALPDRDLSALARAYFGAFTPVRTFKHVSQVVHACADEPCSLGVVPLPEDDQTAAPWWGGLVPAGQAGPRVIAKLPFVADAESNACAYVIGNVEQEPSGEDTTVLLLEMTADLSRTRLQTLLKGIGLPARLAAVSRPIKNGPPAHFLLEAEGFVTASDGRLAALARAAPDAIAGVATVGGYANPIERGSKSSR